MYRTILKELLNWVAIMLVAVGIMMFWFYLLGLVMYLWFINGAMIYCVVSVLSMLVLIWKIR